MHTGRLVQHVYLQGITRSVRHMHTGRYVNMCPSLRHYTYCATYALRSIRYYVSISKALYVLCDICTQVDTLLCVHLLLTSCVLCDKRMQVDTLLCVHLLLTLCVLCDKRTQVDTLLCVHLPHISSLPRAFCVTNACRSIRYYASISSLPCAFCVTNARRSIRYYVSISPTSPPYLVRSV